MEATYTLAIGTDAGAVLESAAATAAAAATYPNSTALGLNELEVNGTQHPSLYYTQQLWGKHIGMIIISVIALIGNGSLVFTIARHKHLRTNTNAFIMSLATADFLFGFPTVPLHIMAESADSSVMLGQSLSDLCLVAMSLTSFQIVISVTMMLALTIERYVSIISPLKHRRWAQPPCVHIVIGITWLYAAVFGALPLMGWNVLHYGNPWQIARNGTGGAVPRCSFLVIHTGQYLGILFLLHILPACVCIPMLYSHMFWKIRQFVQRKNDSLQQAYVDWNGNSPSQLSARRSLRLLVVVVIYFVFSWMPCLIWYVIVTHGFTYTHMTIDLIENISIPSTYYQIAVNLGFANSAVNPYIYGLGNVKIRKTFFQMFGKWTHFGWLCLKRKRRRKKRAAPQRWSPTVRTPVPARNECFPHLISLPTVLDTTPC